MATLKDVLVPDIGDFSDILVSGVLVAVGDSVSGEDPLIELESDKATMEVPAPFAGTVRELKVTAGDRVSEGSAVAVLEVEGAAESAEAPEIDASRPSSEAGAPRAVEGAIAAEVQAGDTGRVAASATQAPASAGGPPAVPGDGPVYASPSVRRIARERAIDLTGLVGTGRKGRITKDDLETADARTQPAPAGTAPETPAPAAAGEQRVELTRIQRISAENLTRAWQAVPLVTHHEDADITELEAFRKQLNAEQSDVKVTMVALLAKACAATLDAFPRFASSLDGDALIVKPQRHIGFAADTPNGLVVPVIRDVDAKGLLALAGELTELSGKARDGKLSPREMSGAVFTISSLGGIGGTGFTPIVNPPQVAILGAVRAAMKPVWDGAAFVPRSVLPLSLSYDHRVIDGAAAARFCVHLKGVLEDLRRVLV